MNTETVTTRLIGSSALLAIASEWRRDASTHRCSCRLHEAQNDRQRADRHYQRALDLDACAKRIEDLANDKLCREAGRKEAR